MTPLEALKPFADAFAEAGVDERDCDRASVWEHPLGMCIEIGDFRRAAAVYAAAVDRSGEAGETSTKIEGSTEGESAVPEGQTPKASQEEQ